MENLVTFLEALATKLGTTTEYLFGVLIKQAEVAVIINTVLLIVFGVATLFCLGFAIYYFWKAYTDDSDYNIGGLLMTLLSIGFLIASSYTIGALITAMYNPEYWALKEILNTVSQ